MPWCEPCAKYLTPTAIDEEGRCPLCGDVVQVHDAHGRITAKNLDFTRLDARTVSFKVTVPADGEATLEYTVKYTW